MTDSPAHFHPLDPNEQPILDKVLVIRDKLSLLKQDKTKYVQSKDIVGLYDEVIVEAEKLNTIRVNKRDEQNRLDTVLDDCLQLISLFFMTVGRNNEAPAAYSMVSTIKRLLDHLKEAAFFANRDLVGMSRHLDKIEESIARGHDQHSPHIMTLLEARIATCRALLAELKQVQAQLSPELLTTHEKLVSILRSLSGCNTRSKFPHQEVQQLKNQLKEIETQFEGRKSQEQDTERHMSLDDRINRYADKLRAMSYADLPTIPGEDIVRDLLERTTLWADIITQRQHYEGMDQTKEFAADVFLLSSTRQGMLDARFKDTFDSLSSIRNQLEKLSLTQAWSLRETDLYSYQRKLDRADEMRVNGNFLDADGQPAELYEQRTLLYLLRKSYATIYFMLASSASVSEALQPIYNQLTTLRKCLVEVQRSGGVASPRELYPYSMKLHSIDNMRQDGKFVVNGDIPEGQGSVVGLLEECFSMAWEMRNQAEKGGDSSGDDDGEDEDDDDDDGIVEMKKASKKESSSRGGTSEAHAPGAGLDGLAPTSGGPMDSHGGMTVGVK